MEKTEIAIYIEWTCDIALCANNLVKLSMHINTITIINRVLSRIVFGNHYVY